MSSCAIKMSFPEIGDVEFKAASSREELMQALALVYQEYLARGFILPKYYKTGLRITLQHALPGAATFLALKDGEVIATVTAIPDSPLSLPMDMGYQEETNVLRRKGRKISEVGYLAIRAGIFGKGLFSMFNFKKLEFMLTLFKLAFQYAHHFSKWDDICIVTNPRFMIFNFLPFEVMGPVRYYGYDRVSVKKKAAVAKRLDLLRVNEIAASKIALQKIFLKTRVPEEIFEGRFAFTPEDLRFFFVEKSDIFKEATSAEREHIRTTFRLDEGAIEKMLQTA